MSLAEYKIVLVGEGGVGKSALIIQLMQNQFSEEYDPTIEDSYRKNLSVDGKEYLLDILDTAGQEEYSSMRDQYVRTGNGFIVVFSLDNNKSLDETENIIKEIRQIKSGGYTPIILAGNKSDIENRRVTTDRIEEMKQKLSVEFLEVSAKRRFNDLLFSNIVRLIRDQGKAFEKKPKKKRGPPCSLL